MGVGKQIFFLDQYNKRNKILKTSRVVVTSHCHVIPV